MKHKNRFVRKLNRVMAYIYVPLLFSVLAYGIIYFMASDTIHIAKNAIDLMVSDEAPNYDQTYQTELIQESIDILKEDGIEKVKRSDVPIYDYGELYAKIKCSKIALDAPVYKGDNDKILMNGVGQNFASFQPGFGGLVLLCGHNNTFFNGLKNIAEGDMIEIETNYGTYCYQVDEMKVLEENDKSAYDFSIGEEQLVLYTCYPFDMLSRTKYRYFVYASLVSGPILVD